MSYKFPLLISALLLASCGGSAPASSSVAPSSEPASSKPTSSEQSSEAASSSKETTSEAPATSSEQPSQSAEGSESGSSSGPSAAERINVCYAKEENNTEATIYYYGGTVPYISIKEYVGLLYRGRTYQEGRDQFEVTKNGNVYTATVAGGYSATFDIENNCMDSADLWGFKNTNLNGTGEKLNVSYDGLPFTRVKDVSQDKAPKATHIDFSSYGLRIYGDENNVYVPVGFATDLFSNENILQGAYNRKDIYIFNYTENESLYNFGEDFYENMFSGAIPEDYAAYYYNELCLDYDLLLGRPGRSSLEQYYDLSKGLDKALDDRELGQTIKSYLKSTDVAKVLAGMELLGVLRLDGGHSGYSPISSSGYYKIDGQGQRKTVIPAWVNTYYQDVANCYHNATGKEYPELVNACASYGHHNDVYAARKTKLGKADRALKGTETYTKSGDIAFIHIDGFMGEIGLQNEWKAYYEGTRDSIPFDDSIGGAVGAISYGLKQAHNDAEIKHIVLDLSANTGGSTDEMLFMINCLTKKDYLIDYNRLSDHTLTTTYEFDLNFDGVFDERDDVSALLEGKDISVLTTQNGFSCGGISPIYLHDDGLFTIGENCGGGSCSVYMQYDAYGVLNRASSPAQSYTINNISVDEARKTSCDSVMTFPLNGKTVDYTQLFDVDELRSRIKAHYGEVK